MSDTHIVVFLAEGGINSPIFFNVDLEVTFREADVIINQLGLSDDIKL